MDLLSDDLTYAICVTGVAVLAYAWLHRRITSVKEHRVERIKELIDTDPETTSAIPTDVLTDKEEREEKKEIVSGVKSRFTVIRWTLLLCFVFSWSLALSFPYLGRLPGTLISIVIAVSTAVIGIAARPLLENLISGIVISFSKQIRVGDTLLMDGQYGTVEDISITHTKIKTWDWKRYVIPNSRMLNKEFVNMTLGDSLIWAHLEFSVAYDADLEEVGRLAREVAASSKHHNGQEEPQFWVMRMEKESVVCWVAAWADSPGDAWNVKSDMAVRLTEAFRQRGIRTHVSRIDLEREGAPRKTA